MSEVPDQEQGRLGDPARKIRIVVAYDGTDFSGWQRQPGRRTVQDQIEQILRRIVNHPLTVHGAGRTDAGVHAAGQAAHFVTTSRIPAEGLFRALGSRLPEDIGLVGLEEVPAEFHASFSAVAKLYRYRIWHSPRRPVEQLLQRYTYHWWRELDAERMQEAAAHFVGRKDFAAMASQGSVRRTTVREVYRCDVYRHDQEVRVDVEGSGFLYNQVRNMVGTLIEVGRGRWAPETVAEILASHSRSQAGPTAPAHGLCLQWVKYIPGLWRPHPDQRPEQFEDAAGEAQQVSPMNGPAAGMKG